MDVIEHHPASGQQAVVPLEPTLPSLSLGGRILFHLARRALSQKQRTNRTDIARTTRESQYRSWRSRELGEQIASHFDPSIVAGRDVVDFGCGTGELCVHLAKYRPARLIGLDVSSRAIDKAQDLIATEVPPHAAQISFLRNTASGQLPLPSKSVDLIACFDALEHLSDVANAAKEWRRILRPDGRVWIWWSAWRGPFGHHLDSLIPLPWVHLFTDERTLFSVCARIYDDPIFVPRTWDVDPETGKKKPNKWQSTKTFAPFLNRLTRRKFDRIVVDSGMRVRRFEQHGFSGSGLSRATRVFLPLPILGDCFVSYYIYELSRA